MITQTIINWLNIIPLCLYIATDDKGYLQALCVLNVLLVLYEIVQVFGDFEEYIRTVVNYIDLVRNMFLYYYLLNYESIDLTGMFLVVTILTFIKGITCFSLFSGTRYLISLMGQALKDTVGFGIITCYSTISFAFINLSIEESGSKDVVEMIKTSYHINIGQFDTVHLNTLQYFIFMLATIVNLILLMNLLISILAGVVEKVQERSDVEDMQQLTKMIIEIEKLFK